MTALRLNLVVVRALDPAALAGFYARLGLTFVTEKHGNGPEHFACEIGGCVFEIYPRQPGDPETTGTRIGFAVPAIDAVLERLDADAIVSAPAETRLGKRCVLKDPEGHKVELLESE